MKTRWICLFMFSFRFYDVFVCWWHSNWEIRSLTVRCAFANFDSAEFSAFDHVPTAIGSMGLVAANGIHLINEWEWHWRHIDNKSDRFIFRFSNFRISNRADEPWDRQHSFCRRRISSNCIRCRSPIRYANDKSNGKWQKYKAKCNFECVEKRAELRICILQMRMFLPFFSCVVIGKRFNCFVWLKCETKDDHQRVYGRVSGRRTNASPNNALRNVFRKWLSLMCVKRIMYASMYVNIYPHFYYL